MRMKCREVRLDPHPTAQLHLGRPLVAKQQWEIKIGISIRFELESQGLKMDFTVAL